MEDLSWHTENIHRDIHRRFTIAYREDSPWHTQKMYHDIHIRLIMTYKEDFSWHRKKIYHDIHVVKRSMPLMEQDLRLCVSLFVPLSFFFWPLHCSSIFDLHFWLPLWYLQPFHTDFKLLFLVNKHSFYIHEKCLFLCLL
jgi:hypothetical protein